MTDLRHGGRGEDAEDGNGRRPTKHYHRRRERLRQRILDGDGAHLRDFELLELLLCAFIPRVDVKPIAKELIAKSVRD